MLSIVDSRPDPIPERLPMNPTREEVLLARALEKPAEKRSAFLDAVCEGAAALRVHVEALHAAHDATIKIDFADAPDEAVS